MKNSENWIVLVYDTIRAKSRSIDLRLSEFSTRFDEEEQLSQTVNKKL